MIVKLFIIIKYLIKINLYYYIIYIDFKNIIILFISRHIKIKYIIYQNF